MAERKDQSQKPNDPKMSPSQRLKTLVRRGSKSDKISGSDKSSVKEAQKEKGQKKKPFSPGRSARKLGRRASKTFNNVLVDKNAKNLEKETVQAELNKKRECTEMLLERFMNKKHWKKIQITKPGGEKLGMRLVKTGKRAVIPGFLVKEVTLDGPAHKTGQIKIGDQIMTINGASVIGMKMRELITLLDGVSKGVNVTIQIVEGGGNMQETLRLNPNTNNNVNINIDSFINRENYMTVTITKDKGAPIGFTLNDSLKDSIIPSVFITFITPSSPADKCGKFQLGDQIMKINGQSTVGLSRDTVVEMAKGCALGCEIELQIVRTKIQSSHKLLSNHHGIKVSDGRIESVEPSSEASEVGVEVGMRIMNIDKKNHFKSSDSEIMSALNEDSEKMLICLKDIEEKVPEEKSLAPSSNDDTEIMPARSSSTITTTTTISPATLTEVITTTSGITNTSSWMPTMDTGYPIDTTDEDDEGDMEEAYA